ncbi:hypothetical protein SAMN05421841_1907 [Chryseobacterium wanjuense]|jgi:hypothetical protein|uniref:Uncharacterized protein n=1 Tax=Chryseobacterium wanjuense TaxID=356305 RepID=A0A1I0QHA5_9FLAO|nr:hypothetical protein [Chryseobacterium wanjuense]SEW26313.1 hypothetical protein SAMN05421841_1907 [Chryseobacterium wanjuense]
MKNLLFLLSISFPILSYSQVGINTPTPKKMLHVNGSLQVTNELSVGGNASTAGSAGTSGQILASTGPGTAPVWNSSNELKGTIAAAYYVQGNDDLTINQGDTGDVPGLTLTITVPAGKTQTLLFTIIGYAIRSTVTDGEATQGVFSLVQNNVKISSAFTASGDFGDLDAVPAPVTFLKSVTLAAGTYTFKVRYTPWKDQQIVNFDPTGYSGYNGDTEAMLSKMQVLVYNN